MDKTQILNGVFLVALAFALAAYTYPNMRNAMQPWNNPTALAEESESAQWAYSNTPKSAVFAADLFACEMITAVAVRTCSIGGAWELADRPNERYQSNEKAFLTESAEEASRELKAFNVTHVLVAKRTGFYAYGWKEPQTGKFSDGRYFELVFEKGKARVYKVLA